ncbi:hypothetical protein VHEMI08040 [[Torrubiella] hemipterigena]|uniref:Histidine-specific methyltransferase SAM-dependent domain-containing protein n=1 Tax=[Torrubiella] hemipterigena TaxID=1531966 RepID=A0A0A1TMG3_9HYPO|nr:hypothetical protein VHEMI08040 [[Torrubiella] hemipterigena]
MTVTNQLLQEKKQARANLTAQLAASLTASPPSLPSLCLWDQRGLQLFEEITHSAGYYPFAAEANLLKESIDDILSCISEHSVMLELGSGSLEKTSIILQGLSNLGRSVDYYALDVSATELDRSLRGLRATLGSGSTVQCHALVCTYDEGLLWLEKDPSLRGRDVTILWLGSSIANEPPRSIQRLLYAYRTASEASGVGKLQFLIGVDGCKEASRIRRAYDLPSGLNREFAMNAITSINFSMGCQVLDPKAWQFHGTWNMKSSRYETGLAPVCNAKVEVGGRTVSFRSNDVVHLIYSQKWDCQDVDDILADTKFAIQERWTSSDVAYSMDISPIDHDGANLWLSIVFGWLKTIERLKVGYFSITIATTIMGFLIANAITRSAYHIASALDANQLLSHHEYSI